MRRLPPQHAGGSRPRQNRPPPLAAMMQLSLSLSATAPPAALRARPSLRMAARQRSYHHARAKPGVRVFAGKVEQLSAEQLEIAIAERDKPLVIDFYARCVRAGGTALWRWSLLPRRLLFVRCLAPLTPAAPRARSWCGPCVLMAAELEKARLY